MATWTSGVDFQFDPDHVVFPRGEHPSYSWEYQTTSDTLTIILKTPAGHDAYIGRPLEGGVTKELYGPEDAKALYQTLRHWIGRYCGDNELEKLDKGASLG